MKKYILVILMVFSCGYINGQEAKFGLKAGVDFANTTMKIDYGSGWVSNSASQTGFYIGGFVEISLDKKFHLQPELLYVSINDLNQFQVPVLAKYLVAPKFNVLAGPDIVFVLNNFNTGSKSLNLGLDFGASYDLNERLAIDAKYNLGLSNLLKKEYAHESVKLNGLFIGLNYKF